MEAQSSAQHRRKSDTSSFFKNSQQEQIIGEQNGSSPALHPSVAEKLSR